MIEHYKWRCHQEYVACQWQWDTAWRTRKNGIVKQRNKNKLCKMNMSLTAGMFPDGWKHSHVVPVPKSSNHSSPTDYRPISLLSILSKLLERHVHGIIAEHVEAHRPLSTSQWGFQARKSTVTALLSTTHNILNLLEAGNEVCAIFFDFRKAFDFVPHRKLLDKL